MCYRFTDDLMKLLVVQRKWIESKQMVKRHHTSILYITFIHIQFLYCIFDMASILQLTVIIYIFSHLMCFQPNL